MATETRDDVDADFADAVNLTAGDLQKWLGTEESREVGQKSGGSGESVGHESGRKIVKILRTRRADLTDADRAHMRKVVGYVHRHLKDRLKGDVTETARRYTLTNWGHDLKK